MSQSFLRHLKVFHLNVNKPTCPSFAELSCSKDWAHREAASCRSLYHFSVTSSALFCNPAGRGSVWNGENTQQYIWIRGGQINKLVKIHTLVYNYSPNYFMQTGCFVLCTSCWQHLQLYRCMTQLSLLLHHLSSVPSLWPAVPPSSPPPASPAAPPVSCAPPPALAPSFSSLEHWPFPPASAE